MTKSLIAALTAAALVITPVAAIAQGQSTSQGENRDRGVGADGTEPGRGVWWWAVPASAVALSILFIIFASRDDNGGGPAPISKG